MSLSELLNAAIRLPANERGRLVHELLQTFEETEDTGVDEAWAAELELRATRVLGGGAPERSLNAVCDELQAKLTR